LQFSIVAAAEDPDHWPDHFDEERASVFLRGYLESHEIDEAQLAVVPLLMQEALIAESALPIATAGSFGRIQGFSFLRMVKRKTQWLMDHSEQWVNAFLSVAREVSSFHSGGGG